MRSVASILIILVVLSGAANILLYELADAGFRKLEYLRVFPLQFSFKKGMQTDKEQCHNKKHLILVGDSRALKWRSDSFDQKYCLTNIGKGGLTTSQVLLPLKNISLTEYEWVIIQVGINDIQATSVLPLQADEIIRRCVQNIHDIIRIMLSHGGNVIITTLFPRAPIPLKRMLYWDSKQDRYMSQVNNEIRKINDDRVIVVDAFSLLSGRDGLLNKKYWTDDYFLHVNNKAYETINNMIIKCCLK